MTKVLHVLEVLDSHGGTPTKLLWQVQHRTRDLEYAVCCIVSEGDLADAFRTFGAEVITLQRGRNYDLRQLWDLVRVILRVDADVVHTHFARANIYGRLAALLTGRPVFVSEHGIKRNTRWPIPWFDSLLNLGTREHISNSEATRRSAQRTVRMNRANMSVVYNGVPDVLTDAGVLDGDVWRTEFGVNGSFVVASIGGHIALRDQATLIRAAALLRHEIPELRVVLIGDGPLRAQLQALAAEVGVADTVEFWGYRPREEIYRFLRASDVFVNPALEEGFGIATVEAMLLEVPVVCAAAGSLPEIISDGESGLLVPPSDPEALTDALLTLYRDRDLRRHLARDGRRHALRQFRVEDFVASFERKYLTASLPSRAKSVSRPAVGDV